MKNGTERQSKLRRGTASLALTAGVVAVVLLLNIAATALCSGFLWYIDLSPESYYNIYIGDTEEKSGTMYTLMDETVNYLDQIIEDANAKRAKDDPVRVEIIFCADPDLLRGMEQMRYVYLTALNLQKQFPDTIQVSYRDVWNNPSSVGEFCTTSYTKIYQTDVIVTSGSEFRVNPVRSFYAYDSDAAQAVPAAYNGQKWFVKQILDVTGAEAPICCLTTNHGEPFAGLDLSRRDTWGEYRVFMNAIEDAGYELRFLNLETDEIPENCRLIITFDPQKDFASSFQDTSVKESETVRLDKFLDKAYSFMVFVDASTPHLPNLEGYLERWGIEFMREKGKNEAGETVMGSYQVSDPAHDLANGGTSFYAQYVPGNGLGNAILSDIISSATTPKIYFDNAMPINIRYSSIYETKYVDADAATGAEAFSFGYYDGNQSPRNIFNMLCAGTSETPAEYAVMKDGKVLTDEAGNPLVGALTEGAYPIMTISRESRTVEEGQGYTAVNQSSYVCAVGSTSFASDSILDTTAYGNIDVLLATLRYIGKEVNPVGLSFLTLYDDAIDEELYSVFDESTGKAQTHPSIVTATVVLTVLPAVIVAGAAVFVLVRRKVRH